MPEPRTLVFGATGSLGGHLLAELVARGVAPGTITAVGRNTDRLAELAGAGFVTAAVDLSDSDGIAEVVAGHSNVILISGGDRNRVAQHLAVIHAAKDAGVEHFYYTSGLRADEGAEINADHKATEDALVSSDMRYTILRNAWYVENYIQAMQGPRHTGILAAAVGNAVVAAASRQDLAEALAVVITTDGHVNTTYSLSGDSDFTYADIANAMSTVLERDVRYVPVTADELRTLLTGAGLDDRLAGFLVGLDETIASGTFAHVGNDLTRLIGRPSTGLVEGLSAR